MKKHILYAIILVLAALLLFSVQKCSYSQKALSVNTMALLDTITYFKNGMGTQTASIQALQLDKQQLEKLVIERDSQLSEMSTQFPEVHTVVKYKSEIRLDTVFVAFTQPLDTLPQFSTSGAVFNRWYSFNYKADNCGMELTNFSLQTETAVVTGIKRKWFLGSETLTADVTNTNPYITITGLKAAELTLPVPWYKKWYVWLAAGTLVGFTIAR